MQKIRLIATELKESCRKDLELTCYGDHIHLCFWSGSRGNKIVVQIVDGNTKITTCQRTWKESVRDFFRGNWRQLLGTLLSILGKLTTALGPAKPELAIVGGVLTITGEVLSQYGRDRKELETNKLYRITQ
jgi:hypothetical protein